MGLNVPQTPVRENEWRSGRFELGVDEPGWRERRVLNRWPPPSSVGSWGKDESKRKGACVWGGWPGGSCISDPLVLHLGLVQSSTSFPYVLGLTWSKR